jgi:hypothetical protein
MKVACSESHSVARLEDNILKSAPILAKGNLVFRTAVEIIEHDFGQPLTSHGPEILYVDDLWRTNPTCSSAGHRETKYQRQPSRTRTGCAQNYWRLHHPTFLHPKI